MTLEDNGLNVRRMGLKETSNDENAYASLSAPTLISGIIIYLVMFVMIDSLGSFLNNFNMLYTTLIMVAPMVLLMIAAMWHMFPSITGHDDGIQGRSCDHRCGEGRREGRF